MERGTVAQSRERCLSAIGVSCAEDRHTSSPTFSYSVVNFEANSKAQPLSACLSLLNSDSCEITIHAYKGKSAGNRGHSSHDVEAHLQNPTPYSSQVVSDLLEILATGKKGEDFLPSGGKAKKAFPLVSVEAFQDGQGYLPVTSET